MVNHSHKISCLVPPERIFERKHPYQLLGVGLIGLGTVSLWPLQTILIRNIENTWGHVTRGNFFLQLATQRRFKLPFTREIASCNTFSLQNNPTAGHTTTCICLHSTGAWNIFFTQICVASCKKKLPHVTAPLTL